MNKKNGEQLSEKTICSHLTTRLKLYLPFQMVDHTQNVFSWAAYVKRCWPACFPSNSHCTGTNNIVSKNRSYQHFDGQAQKPFTWIYEENTTRKQNKSCPSEALARPPPSTMACAALAGVQKLCTMIEYASVLPWQDFLNEKISFSLQFFFIRGRKLPVVGITNISVVSHILSLDKFKPV